MNGEFQCKLYQDPQAPNGDNWVCETGWGIFSGDSFNAALSAAVADAVSTLGGGSGTWTPIILGNG